jgi:hypothetical protein
VSLPVRRNGKEHRLVPFPNLPELEFFRCLETCAFPFDLDGTSCVSVKVEVYFYGDFYFDGVTVFLAGFEAPGLYGFESFFV